MTALAAEATPTADNGPSSGPAMAMAMSFAPAPPAAVTAYIQQFRDADPTDQFQTPASRDWGGNTDPPPASPVPFSPNDPRLAQVVAAVGMAGFSRDPLGNLTYTNQHNFKVALLYATDPNFNPEGIRVANLGATVTIPGGASKFAIALGPKTYTPAGQLGSDMVVAFAGPGYPPAGVVNLPPMAPPATTVSRPTPRATRSGGTVVAASYSAPKLPTLKLSKPPVAQTQKNAPAWGSVGHAVKLAAHLDSVFHDLSVVAGKTSNRLLISEVISVASDVEELVKLLPAIAKGDLGAYATGLWAVAKITVAVAGLRAKAPAKLVLAATGIVSAAIDDIVRPFFSTR